MEERSPHLQHTDHRERTGSLESLERCRIECMNGEKGFYVDVLVAGCQHNARCVLASGHVNVERIEKDGHIVFQANCGPAETAGLTYALPR